MLTLRKQAFGILIQQTQVLLLISIILEMVVSKISAISFLIGGIITISANALFALCLFAKSGAHAYKVIWQNCYCAEIIKWIYTMLFYCLLFKFISVNPLFLFLGFGLPHIQMIWAWRMLLPSRVGVPAV